MWAFNFLGRRELVVALIVVALVFGAEGRRVGFVVASAAAIVAAILAVKSKR